MQFPVIYFLYLVISTVMIKQVIYIHDFELIVLMG